MILAAVDSLPLVWALNSKRPFMKSNWIWIFLFWIIFNLFVNIYFFVFSLTVITGVLNTLAFVVSYAMGVCYLIVSAKDLFVEFG